MERSSHGRSVRGAHVERSSHGRETLPPPVDRSAHGHGSRRERRSLFGMPAGRSSHGRPVARMARCSQVGRRSAHRRPVGPSFHGRGTPRDARTVCLERRSAFGLPSGCSPRGRSPLEQPVGCSSHGTTSRRRDRRNNPAVVSPTPSRRARGPRCRSSPWPSSPQTRGRRPQDPHARAGAGGPSGRSATEPPSGRGASRTGSRRPRPR